MNVLFDGYNPFCKSLMYHPPTTVTTPSRKVEELGTSQPSEPNKNTAGTETIAASSASREKLSHDTNFKVLFAVMYFLLI